MYRRAAHLLTGIWLLLGLGGGLAAEQHQQGTVAELEFFERRIRPLLIENCIRCHGSDRQEGDLRLDRRAGLVAGGSRGSAIEIDNLPASLLLTAVRRSGELKMPPDEPLSKSQIQQLEKWIAAGAAWPAQPLLVPAALPDHWAFRPVVAPAIPRSQPGGWSLNPLDSFIEDRLRRAGLTPSEPADRRTLIRRLYLDVTGLPPSPAEIDQFLGDQAADAYQQLVDRLLAAPQLGERWARHWLDVARYADNKGYVFFEDKNYPWAYAYRDYVVEALNHDLPYDQFILQQLAADQLPNGDDRDLRAMGFLTVGPHFMNNAHDIVDDQIDVITRGLMGVTVSCARCHDHKYDPIPTADYYALYGVLRSSHEPLLPPLYEPPDDTEEYRAFATGMAEREKQLDDYIREKHAALVEDARSRIAAYLMAAYGRRNQPPTDDFMLLTDTDDINPTMVLRYQVYLEEHQQQDDPVWSVWHRYAAIPDQQFEQRAPAVWQSMFGPGGTPPAQLNRLIHTSLSSGPPDSMQQVAEAYAGVLKQVESRWQEIVAGQQGADPASTDLLDEDQRELHLELHGPRAAASVPLVFGWGLLALFPDRGTQGELKKRMKEVETWSVKTAGAPPRAMTLEENEVPFQARVFLRGNPHRLGEDVPPRFLHLLPGEPIELAGKGSRLQLARAIATAKNPLTARVIVNRIWTQYFGKGLVTTPSDFGLRSDPPSHPDLLDFLADRLFAEGPRRGSLKSIHRIILTSATYQQASLDRLKCEQRDPENRLLWKMNRLRLEYEPLRDSLLAVTGQLDLSIGGPPVNQLTDSWNGRRSLYGFIDRMDPAPLLTTFDVPNPVASSAQRSETTVTPQALYLMNHPFTREVAARTLARPELQAAEGSADRVALLFQLILGRLPAVGERQMALDYLGDTTTDSRWLHYVQMLLMTNEFAFRD